MLGVQENFRRRVLRIGQTPVLVNGQKSRKIGSRKISRDLEREGCSRVGVETGGGKNGSIWQENRWADWSWEKGVEVPLSGRDSKEEGTDIQGEDHLANQTSWLTVSWVDYTRAVTFDISNRVSLGKRCPV